MSKLVVVGDSTLAKFNDRSYLFPRYGYATKLDNYFDIEIVNLAMSGRSSLSFLNEDNYKKLDSILEKGDYLLIGFGHNDEKEDDPSRFTSALLDINSQKSFIYTINHYYVELAKRHGATPIVCTPVVRITRDEYVGNVIHNTKTGDYKRTLIDYGNEFNVTVINLTDITKTLAVTLGFDEIKYHHAITKALDKIDDKYVISDSAIDKTHLSEYGAKYVAYLFAKELEKTNCSLKFFLKKDIEKPSDGDIIVNPEYKIIKYNSPDFSNYKNNLYGAVIGSVKNLQGFDAKDNELSDIFLEGKVSFTSTAGAYLFRQIKREDNFICNARIRVSGKISNNEAAFGLMLRDDSYIDFNNNVLASNEILCGLLHRNSNLYLGYYRDETTSIHINPSTDGLSMDGDIIECEISRLGQRINTKLIYIRNGIKSEPYSLELLDFDLFSVDNEYMYIGVFDAKCEKIIVESFNFELKNKAMEA